MKGSLHSRMMCGEITNVEYRNELARKHGFKDRCDYLNKWAKKHGFNDYNDYSNKMCYKKGISQSMSDNKECSSYLGIYIAERILSKIWDNVIRMPYGNPGFDFICGKGFKIDVKSRCLYDNYYWDFIIDENKIADYFLLLAFDDRDKLNPLHIWLIKGDENIKTSRSNNNISSKTKLKIYNNTKSLGNFKKYEQINKLEKLKECCNILKQTKVMDNEEFEMITGR